MYKYIVAFLFLPLFLCAEDSDIFMDSESPSGYTLTQGVLQASTYFNYINLDLANALGAGIDENKAKGVGEYQEKGGQVWFGLTDRVTVDFKFSLTDFEYKDKTANVSNQELRVKRLLVQDNPYIGYLSIEGGWKRHNTNKITSAGIIQNNLTNVLHDHGWSVRFQHTKPFSVFNFNTRLGYHKYPKDGDGGQTVLEYVVGLSKFWNNKNQIELFLQRYDIDRNSPRFSSNTSENTSFYVSYMRQFNPKWAFNIKAQYYENLFRGAWPYMDREVSNLNISRYGFFTIGFKYRFNYSY